MNITAETIKQNYPAIWWSIWKQGFKEAQESPEIQEKMAKQHLAQALAKPGAANPAQALPASTAPQPSAVTISAEQEKINRLMGISPETFIKYSHETPSQLEPAQREMNEKLGIDEQTFLKYMNPR